MLLKVLAFAVGCAIGWLLCVLLRSLWLTRRVIIIRGVEEDGELP